MLPCILHDVPKAMQVNCIGQKLRDGACHRKVGVRHDQLEDGERGCAVVARWREMMKRYGAIEARRMICGVDGNVQLSVAGST